MEHYTYHQGPYVYSPASNIERTFHGTTVVRVAEDRPSRPQMLMPFIDNPYLADQSRSNAFKFHTVRATRLGTPVAITIEAPPTYAQAQAVPQHDPVAWMPVHGYNETWSQAQDQSPWLRQHQHQMSLQQLLPASTQQICIAQPTQHISDPNMFRPSPGPLISYAGQEKAPIETYAPRSFATDGESQRSSDKKIARKQRKVEKKRQKIVLMAQMKKEHSKANKVKSRKKQRERSTSSSPSSSDSSSDSDSEPEEKQQTPQETSQQKKMKKGPKVNHYLEYAIASLFWNLLFGTVAVVLSVSSMTSKKMRKFKQARWEGVFAAVTATLGLVVSVAIVVVVLLYLYTSTICDECNE